MKAAIKEARDGIRAGHGGPFGSVVVKDGKIIGRGHNEVIKNHDPICHGEVMAIRDACKNIDDFSLKGCEIYTTSEPCPMCLGAIMWANIENVYYGCTIADSEDIGFRDSDFYKVLRGEGDIGLNELDRAACLEVFEEYAAIEDKTNY